MLEWYYKIHDEAIKGLWQSSHVNIHGSLFAVRLKDAISRPNAADPFKLQCACKWYCCIWRSCVRL